MQDRTGLEGSGQGAGERDLEAVENPCDAEREDHQGMEAVPRQTVETGRDVGLDHVPAVQVLAMEVLAMRFLAMDVIPRRIVSRSRRTDR